MWNAENTQFLGGNIPADFFVVSTLPPLSAEVDSMNCPIEHRTLYEDYEEHSWSNVGQPLHGWLWGWRGARCKDHCTTDSSDCLDAVVSGLGPRTICLQKLQEPWQQLDVPSGKMMKDYNDDPLDPLDSTQFSNNLWCVKWQSIKCPISESIF